MDPEPIKAYIFGLLGFRDAARFSVDQDNPQLAAKDQEIQQLKQMLESKMAEIDAKNEAAYAKIEAELHAKDAAMEQKDRESERKINADLAIKDAELHQSEREAARDARLQLYLANMSEQTKILVAQIAADSRAQITQSANDNKAFLAALQGNNQKQQGESLQEIAKTITAPRETTILEHNADGMAIRSRSRIVEE
jgi:hypothetical protein